MLYIRFTNNLILIEILQMNLLVFKFKKKNKQIKMILMIGLRLQEENQPFNLKWIKKKIMKNL